MMLFISLNQTDILLMSVQDALYLSLIGKTMKNSTPGV